MGAEKSTAISREKMENRKKEYNHSPRLCKECGIEIKYEKRTNIYCGSSCAALRNNRARGRNDIVCEYCGNLFWSKWGGRFCSRRCNNEHNHREKEKRAENGEILSWRILKTIHIRRGRKCSICNLEMWNGIPITLELDHIDGNSENNTLKNTRIICPNCHSQTPTFKGKNRGNGRFKRQQRYRNGESF